MRTATQNQYRYRHQWRPHREMYTVFKVSPVLVVPLKSSVSEVKFGSTTWTVRHQSSVLSVPISITQAIATAFEREFDATSGEMSCQSHL